jgi:DNA repair protein RecO (recombination protein O)
VRETIDKGYIVHRRRLRETSYVLHVLTQEHGQIGLVMRGGSPTSKRRTEIPFEFRLYQFAWAGASELPTIRRAEPVGRVYRLTGERLFCGLYVNELVARFLHRGDANQAAFNAYEEVLAHLNELTDIEPRLRNFEIMLLQACGYAMALDHALDIDEPIRAERTYYYLPEFGAVSERPQKAHREVSGVSLLALAGQAPWTALAGREAKGLMRFVIHHHLGGKALLSRSLFKHSPSPETTE